MMLTLVLIGLCLALAAIEVWCERVQTPPDIQEFHRRTSSEHYARHVKGGA